MSNSGAGGSFATVSSPASQQSLANRGDTKASVSSNAETPAAQLRANVPAKAVTSPAKTAVAGDSELLHQLQRLQKELKDWKEQGQITDRDNLICDHD